MKLLLDSHLWIWLTSDRDRVGDDLWPALEGAESLVVSVVSLWEIAIKHAAGKLEIEGGMDAMRSAIQGFGALELPIRAEHALRAAALPEIRSIACWWRRPSWRG